MRFAIIATIISISGCATVHPVTGHLYDGQEFRDALVRAIPPGTTTEAAVAFLKSEGFKCDVRIDKPLVPLGFVHIFDEQPPQERGDFIFCERRDPEPGTTLIPVSEDFVWRALILLRNGVVTEIRTWPCPE